MGGPLVRPRSQLNISNMQINHELVCGTAAALCWNPSEVNSLT